jgi:hypothetical protein
VSSLENFSDNLNYFRFFFKFFRNHLERAQTTASFNNRKTSVYLASKGLNFYLLILRFRREGTLLWRILIPFWKMFVLQPLIFDWGLLLLFSLGSWRRAIVFALEKLVPKKRPWNNSLPSPEIHTTILIHFYWNFLFKFHKNLIFR